MPDVFLHHPFSTPAALATILPGAPEGRPDAARGLVLGRDTAGLRPVLAASLDEVAPGRIVTVGVEDLHRLDFCLGTFGGVRQGGPDGDAARYGFAETALQPDPWLSDRLARFLEMLVEIAGHFGRLDAEQVARLLPGIGFRALARVRGRAGAAPTAVRSALRAADVETLALERPYARYFAVEEHALRHRRFDGGWSGRIERGVLASGDGVTVLPFDPRSARVLLVEQFRAGGQARGDPAPWFLEVVAGRIDSLEDPATAARREAREEAGIGLGRIERIAGYYTSPGVTSEFITAFVAEADLDGAGGFHGLAEEHEDIRVHVLGLDAALACLASGEANNAPLMISLFWLAQNRARLVAEWA